MTVARHVLNGALITIAAVFASQMTPAGADPVRVYAAGSLVTPMKALIAVSGPSPEAIATPALGQVGLSRERIETGEVADLFTSADLAQAERLAGTGGRLPAVPFARIRFCVLSREGSVAPLRMPPERHPVGANR